MKEVKSEHVDDCCGSLLLPSAVKPYTMSLSKLNGINDSPH